MGPLDSIRFSCTPTIAANLETHDLRFCKCHLRFCRTFPKGGYMRPTRIKLGAHTIPVVWHKELIDCEEDNRTIYDLPAEGYNGMAVLIGPRELHVSEQSYDPQETLLHEVLHYAYRNHGFNRMFSREQEELVVQGLAQSVIEVLRRNKGLAGWLTDA